MHYYQHGDVVCLPVKKLPPGLQKLNSHTLAEGEHTGHAHRLMFRHDDIAGGSAVYQHPTSLTKFFELKSPTALTHEEHKTIELPPGLYEVGIVQEYDYEKEETRNVAD